MRKGGKTTRIHSRAVKHYVWRRGGVNAPPRLARIRQRFRTTVVPTKRIQPTCLWPLRTLRRRGCTRRTCRPSLRRRRRAAQRLPDALRRAQTEEDGTHIERKIVHGHQNLWRERKCRSRSEDKFKTKSVPWWNLVPRGPFPPSTGMYPWRLILSCC